VLKSEEGPRSVLSNNVGEGITVNRIPFRSIVWAASALAPATVSAADIYTQPQMDVRVEHNDNFTLSPADDTGSDTGYVAELSALVGIATPKSDTSLRPSVRLQEFPDRKDLERVEASLDLASHVRGQRSNWFLDAELSRRDVYNTETPSGDFDPGDPGGGDDPEAGVIVFGETRTQVELRPSFDYRITERTSIGAEAHLQSTRYDADGPTTRTDYDYGVFQSHLTWALNPTADFTVGAYASRYEATDESEETDAVGGLIGYAYRWSERAGFEARVFHEENDTTIFFPVAFEESTSNFGGEVVAYRRQEVSTWQLAFGRSFVPTGDGGKSEFDRFRIAYDRKLSERFGFKAAARYDSRNGLSNTDTTFDRDYARIDVSLRWFMSPTWYIGGGYAYIWEDREATVSDADNNKVYINFGYRGLEQPRR